MIIEIINDVPVAIDGISPSIKFKPINNFSPDVINNSKPTKIITNATINVEIYSILPCPNGWSLSGFLFDNLAEIILTIDENESRRWQND